MGFGDDQRFVPTGATIRVMPIDGTRTDLDPV
jgi:hypothetical protein